jgi:hypothetical protein
MVVTASSLRTLESRDAIIFARNIEPYTGGLTLRLRALTKISLKIAKDNVELPIVFPSCGDIDGKCTTFSLSEDDLERFDPALGIAECINICSESVRVGYPAPETVPTPIIHH